MYVKALSAINKNGFSGGNNFGERTRMREETIHRKGRATFWETAEGQKHLNEYSNEIKKHLNDS